MSTFFDFQCTCFVCGAENEYHQMGSTNTFGGGPDLDLRPAEMMRSTMFSWVQECPNCGYVSQNVSDLTTISEDYLKTSEYLSCDGIDFASVLAARFYKYHKISLTDQNPKQAFYAVLHAAWVCDDKSDTENAKRCRAIALSLVDELINDYPDDGDTYKLMKADLLRRSERFDELVTEYASESFSDDLLNKILAFQLDRAKAHDAKCYRVQDATGE